MTILDRANTFIGHEQEVDEGYETTMRRNAFIAGFKEALELVKEMRKAQKDEDTFESEMYRKYRGNTWLMSVEELNEETEKFNNTFDLESEVDELIKEMEGKDRRKSLEAENTEFDYGHNVKHYSED